MCVYILLFLHGVVFFFFFFFQAEDGIRDLIVTGVQTCALPISFRRRLGLEHWLIADMSSGRKLRWNERAAFRAATSDPVVARALEEVATRRRSSLRMLDPRLTFRVLREVAGSSPSS